jgi:hypothetical protein
MNRRRLAALALGLAALPLFTALTTGPAGAAEGGVVVRNVDTREYPTVRLDVLVNGAEPKLSEFTVRENNKVIPGDNLEVRPLKQTAKPIGTVLVVDTHRGGQGRCPQLRRRQGAQRVDRHRLVLQPGRAPQRLHPGLRRPDSSDQQS